MKIARQFQYIEYAKYNEINPTDTLIRLMEDNPYIIEKIFFEKLC